MLELILILMRHSLGLYCRRTLDQRAYLGLAVTPRHPVGQHSFAPDGAFGVADVAQGQALDEACPAVDAGRVVEAVRRKVSGCCALGACHFSKPRAWRAMRSGPGFNLIPSSCFLTMTRAHAL